MPLPGTGGWTGALLASLLHLDKKKSFGVICIGVFIAGLIITILSLIFGAVVF
ncbi:MAG: small multi-drug export protein [Eubacterium sp.]